MISYRLVHRHGGGMNSRRNIHVTRPMRVMSQRTEILPNFGARNPWKGFSRRRRAFDRDTRKWRSRRSFPTSCRAENELGTRQSPKSLYSSTVWLRQSLVKQTSINRIPRTAKATVAPNVLKNPRWLTLRYAGAMLVHRPTATSNALRYT